MNVPDETIYKRCIDKWGVQAQLDMVIEECLELALQTHRDKRGRTTVDEVAEEAADVYMVLHQLAEIIGEDKIQPWIDTKCARLEERLKGE